MTENPVIGTLKYIIELDCNIDLDKFIFINDIGLFDLAGILIKRDIILEFIESNTESVKIFKIADNIKNNNIIYNNCIIDKQNAAIHIDLFPSTLSDTIFIQDILNKIQLNTLIGGTRLFSNSFGIRKEGLLRLSDGNNYYDKYLKYKTKYLEYKKQLNI
jgi:hypothetical protein